MEHLRHFRTPNKAQKCDSPRLHMTPVKQNETRSKHTAYHNKAGHFTVLPSYITPPSGLTKIVRKNPFDTDLTNRLHQSMISPTVFTKVSNPVQSPEFAWTIEELAYIQPAKIEESPIDQINSTDPEIESKAQAAIDRFFKQNQIVPSPWEVKKKEHKLNINIETPLSRPLDNLNSVKELLKVKRDVWSQTVLSLPINLPQNVEDTLKSYLTFTQEQGTDSDDVNLSNNSLRRKLFFNHECIDNDNDSFVSSTSFEMSGSMALAYSPPQSGMFAQCTLKKSLETRRYSDRFKSLSPPYMSPIHDNKQDILCKRHCSYLTTQLDLTTNMSIDDVDVKKSQNLIDVNLFDTSNDMHDINYTTDDYKSIIINNDETNICISDSIKEISRCVSPINNTVHSGSIIFNDGNCDATSLKFTTEVEKSSTRESRKPSFTMFGTFNRQNISSSVQDTGYQTYSMNSTMHTADSYNDTSNNRKICSSEQMVMFKDDTQLSWREGTTNLFSSTPSKCNKEKEVE